MKNYVTFDTETTSLDKPFCYNIGYIIHSADGSILLKKEFVVEQVWHNLPLFNSAYYANKRPLYVSAMKGKKAKLDKFGYICREMSRDFKAFEIETAFAYNSGFDERVFEFNCDWYKVSNPFDNIAIKDIRGFVHEFLVNDDFKKWCDEREAYTESGHYSTTAETIGRYIFGDDEFKEEHTALADSELESTILMHCVSKGADLEANHIAKRSIERKIEKTLHISTAEQIDYYFDYSSIRINKDKTEIKLK